MGWDDGSWDDGSWDDGGSSSGGAHESIPSGSVVVTSAMSVGMTRVLAASIEDFGLVTVRNDSGSAVYLGGDDVTTSNGWPLAAGTSVSMHLCGTDELYVVAGSSLTVSVLLQPH